MCIYSHAKSNAAGASGSRMYFSGRAVFFIYQELRDCNQIISRVFSLKDNTVIMSF